MKSVVLGVALGAAVGGFVAAVSLAPGTFRGNLLPGEARSTWQLFVPAGIFAGTGLGLLAPFVRAKRLALLSVAAFCLYFLAAIFSTVRLSLIDNGSLPTPRAVVFVLGLAMTLFPFLAVPAWGALFLLERLTRPRTSGTKAARETD